MLANNITKVAIEHTRLHLKRSIEKRHKESYSLDGNIQALVSGLDEVLSSLIDLTN